MGRLGLVIITMVSLLLVSHAGAEVQTITATHTYTLGNIDSRNDARQLSQSLEPSSLLGTIEVVFMPEQTAGIIDGCTLGYRVISQDHLYRNGARFIIVGNITYSTNKDRSGHVLSLKIGVLDTLDASVRSEPPFFAYIQTAHGTTARSLFKQFDSPDPNMRGFRHFMYGMDENTMSLNRY